MARFLQRVLNRKENLPRSSRQSIARRARPTLERLEERWNPIIAILIGMPSAIVQMNPGPLPPIVLLDFQFSNSPPLGSAPVHVTDSRFDLLGHFTQMGESSTAAGAAPTHWSLDVLYSLAGKFSENSQPASAGTPATFTVSAEMSGPVFSRLTIDQPGGKNEVVSEGALMQYSVAGQGIGEGGLPKETITFNFQALALRYMAQTSGNGPSQSFLINLGWTGTTSVMVSFEQGAPSAPVILGSFTEKYQINESVTPVNPSGTGAPPNADTLIDALFSAAGSYRTVVQPSDLLPDATVLKGQTLSLGQLNETITPPPVNGSTAPIEMVSESSMEQSNFHDLERGNPGPYFAAVPESFMEQSNCYPVLV
jgi:hypothetical protein